MTNALTIDSNILIYAFDPTNPEKHRRSILILDAMLNAHAVLPMQCLSEFYSVVTRKRFLTPAAAESIIHGLIETLMVVPSEIVDLASAMQLKRLHGLQYFDSLIIMTARRAGCTVLISEDMQAGREISGLKIVDAFQLSQEAFEELFRQSRPN